MMKSFTEFRVAVLSVHTCPLATLGGKETGGMNVYVRDLSRQLGRWGIKVDVYTRAQDPDIVGPRRLGPNARVVHIPAGPLAPYSKEEVYEHLGEFVQGVLGFTEAERLSYDLIHSHYWLSGLVAKELKGFWRVPVIQMFHTLGRIKNQVARSEEERASTKRIEAEAEIMRFADRIVAASPLERDDMVELYGASAERIEVIPCGVDLKIFHPMDTHKARARLKIPEDRRMLLFVGRVQPLKGIDTLLKAVALFTDNMRQLCGTLCLTIIGGNPDGPMDREMRRLTRLREKLGIKDLVTFLGARDQDMLPLYYCAAEVCVVPSYHESFGMVALEAMACGIPVLASRVGGLTFTMEDGVTGYLVPHGEPKVLAERLGTLLTDETLRRCMGKEGMKVARRYGWPIVAQRIVSLYGQLTRPIEISCHGE